MEKDYMDDEERDFFESLNDHDFRDVPAPSEARQNELKTAATSFLKKETKMNIRIDSNELDKIKAFASEEGLKYQTFVKSILHKYITGQLVEKRKSNHSATN